jgi:hypothetical protein
MANKGRGKDDGVVEAISPGGHVMKRRARSRPVSQELLESEFPPFTIADSGNCLSANSIFTITDCLTIQIDMTSARTMVNRNADPISLPSLTDIRSRAAPYSLASHWARYPQSHQCPFSP